MPAFLAPLAISGISALAGMFGNRKQTSQQSNNQSFNRADSFDQTDLPAYDEFQQNYRDQIYNKLLERLNSDPNREGYSNSGLAQINRAGDARQQALNHILASRGLQNSPIAGYSAASADSNRVSDSVGFLNQIPMLADQRQRENLGSFADFFSRMPVGSRRSGTNSQSGSSSESGTFRQPGNMLGGGLAGLGSALAGFYGQGAFTKKSEMGNT